MAPDSNTKAAMFGCNTYAYMLSQRAETCIERLAEFGFLEFEVMVHPGHLWPAELSADERSKIRGLLQRRGLKLTTLNLPNIDINIVSTTPEMRAYSLNLMTETVRLAGELGAPGVVLSPGKASPLLPASRDVLEGFFFSALDRLGPIANACGTALWLENVTVAFEPTAAGLMDLLRRYGNDAVRVVYDVANAYFFGEDVVEGLHICGQRLALVHLSDTDRKIYRHDPIGAGSVPFAAVPKALALAGYRGRPMLEIISSQPDSDILASVDRLGMLGFCSPRTPTTARSESIQQS